MLTPKVQRPGSLFGQAGQKANDTILTLYAQQLDEMLEKFFAKMGQTTSQIVCG